MGEKVVSLTGKPVVAPGIPQVDLIEDIEKILEMARAGEIQAIAYVVRYHDDLTSYRWVGTMTRAVIGCLELIKHALCAGELES